MSLIEYSSYAATKTEKAALAAMDRWLAEHPRSGRINPIALIKSHYETIPASAFYSLLDRMSTAGILTARYALLTDSGLLTEEDFESPEAMQESDLFDHHDDPIEFDSRRVVPVYRPRLAVTS